MAADFVHIRLLLSGTRASAVGLTTTTGTRACLFSSRPFGGASRRPPPVIINVRKYYQNNRTEYGLPLWSLPNGDVQGSDFLAGLQPQRQERYGRCGTNLTKIMTKKKTSVKEREKRLLRWKSREK